MKSIPRIVICGSISTDRIMNFEGSYKDVIAPDKIHTLSISVFLQNLKDTRGGVGANIAYTLALLGESPILLGAVGKDGCDYMASLAAIGVDIKSIVYSRLSTASFNVITDQDDNQVGGFYPGAMFDSDKLSFLRWKEQNILAVISPHDPKAMRRQVKECARFHRRLFYDVGQQVSNIEGSDIVAGIKACELLIVNDYELGVICEKTKLTEAALKAKVPVVVTTLGKRGSVIEGNHTKAKIKVDSAKPKHVVDPTGAGDAYRAGFLYGYVRGFELKVCGQMGSVAAVYAVETHGTQEHHFSPHQFEARYSENFNENLILK